MLFGSSRLVRAAFASLALSACGGAPPDPPEELPDEPQLFANSAFVIFPLTRPGLPSQRELLLVNGGKADLVVDEATLTGDATLTIESITPDNRTATSRQAVTILMTYDPAARGVAMASLHITSNSENAPDVSVDVLGPASTNPISAAPDVAPWETTVEVIPDVNLLFVRFFNLGERSAALATYEINPAGGRFALAPGSASPTIAEPIPLASGAFVVLTLRYDAAVAGADDAQFTLTTYDYADVEYPDGVRTVPDEALSTVTVNLTLP